MYYMFIFYANQEHWFLPFHTHPNDNNSLVCQVARGIKKEDVSSSSTKMLWGLYLRHSMGCVECEKSKGVLIEMLEN